jgi:hypothetical protein
MRDALRWRARSPDERRAHKNVRVVSESDHSAPRKPLGLGARAADASEQPLRAEEGCLEG